MTFWATMTPMRCQEKVGYMCHNKHFFRTQNVNNMSNAWSIPYTSPQLSCYQFMSHILSSFILFGQNKEQLYMLQIITLLVFDMGIYLSNISAPQSLNAVMLGHILNVLKTLTFHNYFLSEVLWPTFWQFLHTINLDIMNCEGELLAINTVTLDNTCTAIDLQFNENCF